jgi:2-methylisocitrate lyase-like PEP mutase family enzyme
MAILQAQNLQAKSFQALHQPGNPLILVNVHDATSARIIASHPSCKALATASYSVALASGTVDDKLTLERQFEVVKNIAEVAREAGKPLTVDLQDGYGDRLDEAIKGMIELGVVGVNLEDSIPNATAVLDIELYVSRIKRALEVAREAGVPEFVVNARSDALLRGGTLDESIRRGNELLKAGATSIYIIKSGPNGLSADEIRKCVEELDGKVNVGLKIPKESVSTSLSSKQLAEIGVARISIGPQLYLAMQDAIKQAADAVFSL